MYRGCRTVSGQDDVAKMRKARIFTWSRPQFEVLDRVDIDNVESSRLV